jgi:hypothetical protein
VTQLRHLQGRPAPMELPATCADSIPSSSRRKVEIRRAKPAAVGGVPSGAGSEPPCPERSKAITSWRTASVSSTGSHTCQWLPVPWIKSSGSRSRVARNSA